MITLPSAPKTICATVPSRAYCRTMVFDTLPGLSPIYLKSGCACSNSFCVSPSRAKVLAAEASMTTSIICFIFPFRLFRSGVLVIFAVQRFEVVSQCECRRQRHENRQCGLPSLHAADCARFCAPHGNDFFSLRVQTSHLN